MKTLKTNFNVSAAFAWSITGTDTLEKEAVNLSDGEFVGTRIKASIPRGKTITLEKYISVISDRYYETDKISNISVKKAQEALDKGYNGLFSAHKKKWADIWSMGDISISGDTAAQQGRSFNIYQLNCMYSGDDPRLNIGPKGFTGEKYGGGTYWDTEAYCLYFYLGTRKPEIARNLLEYRYNHLEKAKENSAKLGTRGALYHGDHEW